MTKKYSRFPDQERPAGGWLYGQLTEAEVEFFCKLAFGRSVPLVLTGSLAETGLGLRRRYTSILQGFLAKFRRQKPESEMIDTAMKGQVPVVRDIDFWAGSSGRNKPLTGSSGICSELVYLSFRGNEESLFWGPEIPRFSRNDK